MSISNIGKRIKSDTDRVYFARFPNSDDRYTLPAGKPSPEITSYLASGYYQFQIDGVNYYIKKLGTEEIVTDSEPDESRYFSGIVSGFGDWIANTKRDVSKQAGFLSEGFEKSFSDVSTGFFDFSKNITPIIWGIVALGVIWLISKFTD